MSEKVFKSAGVFAKETDLSRPVTTGPTGIPAGVVGTATDGPAFVPVTVGSYSDFVRIFGSTDGEKFGPLAVYTFLQKAQALTYLRVLGVGDGKKRDASTGKVTRAGFAVGGAMVQADGIVGNNPDARTGPSAPGGYGPHGTSAPLGRTYFLGCFMSQSAGSTVFSEAGINSSIQSTSASLPIIRGVLMAPSGVILHLSSSTGATSLRPTGSAGSTVLEGGLTGSVNLTTSQFVMLLNGHIGTNDNPSVLTASFDFADKGYFANIFNTDAALIQEKGHYLYTHYDIEPRFAVVTGSGVVTGSAHVVKGAVTHEDVAFLLTGSAARDTTVSNVSPNYESFNERFTHAKTPFFISQDYGGTKHNLFRVHAKGDGEGPTSKFKISVLNITPKTEVATDKFGTFDVLVREFEDQDVNPQILERHMGVNLDPSSEKYIARIIGDQNVFFDFDQSPGSQKLVVEGSHAGNSSLIRVEMARAVESGQTPEDSLPMGFRGPDHLITSGSGPLCGLTGTMYTGSAHGRHSRDGPHFFGNQDLFKQAVVLPLRFRSDVKTPIEGNTDDITANASLFWGVQFKLRVPDQIIYTEFGKELRSLNKASAPFDTSMYSRTKFFPSFSPGKFNFSVGNNPGAADINGTVLDCDKFNNNIFTLEKIRVRTGSDGYADTEQWRSASYIRDGKITDGTNKCRALKVTDLLRTGNRKYAKYTTFLQGGFDGVDIFNTQKADLSSTACKREIDDITNQGGTSGATVATYRKAVDIMSVKSDVDVNLLTIPGIRNASVTDYAMTAVENRFDSLYIMDIEQRDEFNVVMTGSKDASGNKLIPNVANTVVAFAGRGLNSSFTAAYFPDVIMTDPTTQTNVVVPPSVAVLGAMSLTDSIAYPWFAPAGYSRGLLDSSIIATDVSLNRSNLDDLYEEKINPLTSFAGGSPVVWGQKTLLANASALDRINVRRLLIDVRRKVKNVANSLLFEPNRQETLDRFNSLVKPILQRVQQRSGVDRFKVIIDTTTTTQADIENNTIRGKIYLQPTRTAEFIALDFTVANSSNFDSV